MNKNFKTMCLTIGSIVSIFIVAPMLFGYKIGYYSEIVYDYDAIDTTIQIIGIIISALLTFLIINQTNVINKKQLKFEADSVKKQEDMQKKQLKIDLFDHRVIVFEWLLKLFSNMSLLIKVDQKENTLKDKIDTLIKFYEGMKIIDEKYFDIFPMYRSEFLFDGQVVQSIRTITKQYSEISVRMTVLSRSKEDMKAEWCMELYNSIIENCNVILSYQGFIDQISKIELDIAGFDR